MTTSAPDQSTATPPWTVRIRQLLRDLWGGRIAPPPPAWLPRVRVPQTANAWQLYTGQPGADAGAADLAAAAVMAAAEIDEAIRRFVAHMVAYSDLGATDTEPACVARELFTRITCCAIDRHL